MKVKELITMARSLMMDNMSSTHLDVYAMTHVNVLIAELFEENNGLRSKKNKTRLYQIPIVKSEDDELIYEEEMLYNINLFLSEIRQVVILMQVAHISKNKACISHIFIDIIEIGYHQLSPSIEMVKRLIRLGYLSKAFVKVAY